MRMIGLDIHRAFAEAVALGDGVYKRIGRIGMTRDHLRAFAETLHPTDHVIVEATGNATAVLEILAPKVERVAAANPFQVHLIARAKTRTDKIDARVLAQLYAAGFLPEVWIPDEAPPGTPSAGDTSQPAREEPRAAQADRAVNSTCTLGSTLSTCRSIWRKGAGLDACTETAGRRTCCDHEPSCRV
jgi:hypothetical protein